MSTPPSNDRSGTPQASGPQDHVDGPAKALSAIARARDIEELERVRRALEASSSAAYHWNLETDELRWNSAAGTVLDVADLAGVSTGRGLANLTGTADQNSRYDAIMRSRQSDAGEGVCFNIEYSIHPHGRSSGKIIWVEESGRWFADADGKPCEVYGTLRRIDDRHAREQQLEFLGFRDPLTGMMNRGRLAETLGKTIERCKTQGGTCGLLIVVINNLAVVNDAYGFDIADEVIVSIGQKLKRVVRQDDKIARYSGAKFAILLNQCTQIEIELAAERFLRVGRDSVIETEKGPVWAMLSIGGIFLPRNADSANAAMACAEEALAEAKRHPNDGFVIFEPSPERVSVRELNARCAAEIVTALRQQRLALAYQSVVDAATGDAVMYEALLRMNCDDGSIVAANHLIPIAEKLGLVRLIDQTVVKMAMRALHRFADTSIAVNISGATAMDQRWFIDLAEEIADQPDLAQRMVIEINESAILRDIEAAQSCINRLKELGCAVAIDDFGAGSSAFRNLKSLNVDYVKLDGTYCEQLSGNPDNQYFVRSLIELAKKFGFKVIAEWVETDEDAALLRDFGVDFLQGHLFGEALVIDSAVGEEAEPAGPEELFVLPTDLSINADTTPFDASALAEMSNAAGSVPAARFEDVAEKQPFDAQFSEPAQPAVATGLGEARDTDPFEPFVPQSTGSQTAAAPCEPAEQTEPLALDLADVPAGVARTDDGMDQVASARQEPDAQGAVQPEPFVPLQYEPDLSRLKSAMSALNGDFAGHREATGKAAATGRPDDPAPADSPAQIDLASAISRKFTTG